MAWSNYHLATYDRYALYDLALLHILSNKYVVFHQHNFGESFDMVLVMPTENPRDLDLLSAHLVENADDNRIENIFDTINREVDSDEAYGGEVELIMPEFEVKSDLPIRDMLENVRTKVLLFILS